MLKLHIGLSGQAKIHIEFSRPWRGFKQRHTHASLKTVTKCFQLRPIFFRKVFHFHVVYLTACAYVVVMYSRYRCSGKTIDVTSRSTVSLGVLVTQIAFCLPQCVQLTTENIHWLAFWIRKLFVQINGGKDFSFFYIFNYLTQRGFYLCELGCLGLKADSVQTSRA